MRRGKSSRDRKERGAGEAGTVTDEESDPTGREGEEEEGRGYAMVRSEEEDPGEGELED